MFKLVLLDFDDTLCLTEEACFSFENALAQEMGFSPMTHEMHKSNWGKPLQDIISERIPGIDPAGFMGLVRKRMPEYIKEGKLDTISEENLHTLHQLRQAGKILSVVTSRSIIEAEHLLHETHPLNGLLDGFYHRDNLEYLKPDPRVFAKVLMDFQLKPNECVYVGDSVSDAIAAKGARMQFIAVLESGLRIKEDFSEQEADFFASKFTDILPISLAIR